MKRARHVPIEEFPEEVFWFDLHEILAELQKFFGFQKKGQRTPRLMRHIEVLLRYLENVGYRVNETDGKLLQAASKLDLTCCGLVKLGDRPYRREGLHRQLAPITQLIAKKYGEVVEGVNEVPIIIAW